MSALPLLDERRGRGVELAPDGERTRCRAPRGTLTPELRRALADRKAELLAELEAEAAAADRARTLGRLAAFAERRGWAPLQTRHGMIGGTAEAWRKFLSLPPPWLPEALAAAETQAGGDPGLVVNGYRWTGSAWTETAERAACCVIHGARPLAPGDKLLCAGCRAAADAMPATEIDGVSLPVPRDVAPDDPRLREVATVAALAAAHRGVTGGGRP